MIKKLRLWWYRREARLGYQAYHRTAGAYDCGRGLLLEISGRATSAARRHDQAMFRLRSIDPDDFPSGWEPILGEPS